jgi:8-oxo-dGTP pyrophosphatase MutT (NUDIX family)
MEFPESKALVTGKLTAENFNITIGESNLNLTLEIGARIEEIWKDKQVESKERGADIYNGVSYRVNNWSYDQKTLGLELSLYDYKHRLGLITMIKNGEISSYDYPHNGCFVGATVLTSDDLYIMVKLSGTSMNLNTLEMLGGMVETETQFSDQNFLFDVLYQELEEEAGITNSDITQCYLESMFTGGTSHFGFYFNVVLDKSSSELQKRFVYNQDTDIESLVFLSREEYLITLKDMSNNKRLIASIIETHPDSQGFILE